MDRLMWRGRGGGCDEKGERLSRDNRDSDPLRVRGGDGSRVTSMELFFDLVYVFAVTQLSHLLLAHLDLRGALHTALLLLAVWWAWVYTAWITNWFDPNRRAVRLMLVGVMVASLLMSASLPNAYGDRGLLFAGAYVAMQVGRSLWAVLELRAHPELQRNFQRILFWSAASGVLWIAGGLANESRRGLLWLAAVIVDYLAPICGFVTPGLGRSTTREWDIAGGHLAERCELFLIIALGESILVTGATFGELDLSAAVLAAFVVAFLGSVALWWVYFDRAAGDAEEAIASSADPGRLGRSAYTYLHLPMVAGIIVAAVGDELAIAHPLGHADLATAATVLGGPALFLAGHLLFKRAVFGVWSLPRLGGIAALVAVGVIGRGWPPLLLASVALLVVASIPWWDARIAPADTVPVRSR
jgi:low temperature requirement protein LtrA